jgi:hypothetical protein
MVREPVSTGSRLAPGIGMARAWPAGYGIAQLGMAGKRRLAKVSRRNRIGRRARGASRSRLSQIDSKFARN